MTRGFTDGFDFSPIVGWELYQITLDKYHVMFWFENERCLLNVANKFSFRSADKKIEFEYEIYGSKKYLNLDDILRAKISEVQIVSRDRLDIVFTNGAVLSIYDDPSTVSWWFLWGREFSGHHSWTPWKFEIGDEESKEDLQIS